MALKVQKKGVVPAKRQASPPATRHAPPPAVIAGGYEEDADSGFEHADASAFSIPRLYMLQDLNPQVKSRDPGYVEGAEAGMIFNSVTKQPFSHLYAVACLFRQTFVEWTPREAGGGFIAEHAIVSRAWTRERGGPYITSDNTHVNDTRNFFLLVSEDVGKDGLPLDPVPVVLSMTSTQIRRAQDWMTIMDQKRGRRKDGSDFRMPMFSSVFLLEGEYSSNDKGSWYSWKIQDTSVVIPADDPIYEMARAFKARVKGGLVTVEPHEPMGETDIPASDM